MRTARTAPGREVTVGDGALLTVGVAVAVVVGLLVAAQGLPAALVPAVLVAAAGVALLALERFEWFVVVALVVRSSLDVLGGRTSGVAPAQVLGLGFLAASAIWLAARWRSGEWVPLWTPTKLLLLFTGFSALSLVAGVNRSAGVLELSRIVAASTMLVVLNQLIDGAAALRRYTGVLLCAGVVPFLWGAVQLTTGQSLRTIGDYDRVHSTFLHPNPFAMFCGIVLIVGLALYHHIDGTARRVVAVAVVAAGANLLFTYTRGAWVAVAVGLAVVAARTSPRVLLAVGAAAVAAYLFVPSIAGRVEDTQSTERVGVDENNSVSWRVGYWRESLTLAGENPITGIGLKGVSESTAAAKQPHNDYVRTFVETGLLGFAAFTAFTVSAIVELRRAVRRTVDDFGHALATGALGATTAFVVFALSANVISQVVVLWYLVLVLALGIAAGRVEQPAPAPTERALTSV